VIREGSPEGFYYFMKIRNRSLVLVCYMNILCFLQLVFKIKEIELIIILVVPTDCSVDEDLS